MLGFNRRWVRLIMACVIIATYSVMVNGEAQGYIKSSRGLRQGDLMSPYLFLICVEGLSAFIRRAERDQLFRGIAICRCGPRLSHLFFANNSVIFYRASTSDCGVIHNLLSLYEKASSQKLIRIKRLYFLVRIHLLCIALLFSLYLVHLHLFSLRSTLVYHLLWADQNDMLFMILKIVLEEFARLKGKVLIPSWS